MAGNKYDTTGIEISKPEVSNETQYHQLMSNLKAAVKTMSHNRLAAEYVSLFAQYVLLQRRYDDLNASTQQVKNIEEIPTTNHEAQNDN